MVVLLPEPAAGQQHQALVVLAELLEGRWQVQPDEVGDPVVDPPGDQADVALIGSAR